MTIKTLPLPTHKKDQPREDAPLIPGRAQSQSDGRCFKKLDKGHLILAVGAVSLIAGVILFAVTPSSEIGVGTYSVAKVSLTVFGSVTTLVSLCLRPCFLSGCGNEMPSSWIAERGSIESLDSDRTINGSWNSSWNGSRSGSAIDAPANSDEEKGYGNL